jgi:two-component system cell cycle response regulator CpdR
MPKRPRILVVDDEELMRRFVECALDAAGYEVVGASNGPEALECVERHPPFDLFILDLMMPQMEGDELSRRLHLRDPDAKVLYLTGHSDRLFAQRQVLWENEAFLDKPVSLEGLLEGVSLMLSGHIAR